MGMKERSKIMFFLPYTLLCLLTIFFTSTSIMVLHATVNTLGKIYRETIEELWNFSYPLCWSRPISYYLYIVVMIFCAVVTLLLVWLKFAYEEECFAQLCALSSLLLILVIICGSVSISLFFLEDLPILTINITLVRNSDEPIITKSFNIIEAPSRASTQTLQSTMEDYILGLYSYCTSCTLLECVDGYTSKNSICYFSKKTYKKGSAGLQLSLRNSHKATICDLKQIKYPILAFTAVDNCLQPALLATFLHSFKTFAEVELTHMKKYLIAFCFGLLFQIIGVGITKEDQTQHTENYSLMPSDAKV
eukprot:snap_masked-scaffold_1-processed-gene-23.47-mRNA-1 protein AED:1.00 eAED:1.00 QI:0/0/0/0/1/1/2/0/305